MDGPCLTGGKYCFCECKGSESGNKKCGSGLTGNCFSRQLLKFLVWLGFSFLRGIRVSPMNSLWRNLSSSHTEILEERRDGGGGWGEEDGGALKPSFYSCCPSDAARHQTDLILARGSVLDPDSASSMETFKWNERRSAAAESPCGRPEEGIAEFCPS